MAKPFGRVFLVGFAWLTIEAGACQFLTTDEGFKDAAAAADVVVDICRANGADTPLLRSEWFKYAGLFFNKDVEANVLYSSIRNIYNTLIRAAATAASSSGRPKPVVLWIYKGWNADFVVSYPLFKRTYIQVRVAPDTP